MKAPHRIDLETVTISMRRLPLSTCQNKRLLRRLFLSVIRFPNSVNFIVLSKEQYQFKL